MRDFFIELLLDLLINQYLFFRIMYHDIICLTNKSITLIKMSKDLKTEPRCKFWTDGNRIIMGIQKTKQEDEGGYR